MGMGAKSFYYSLNFLKEAGGLMELSLSPWLFP